MSIISERVDCSPSRPLAAEPTVVLADVSVCYRVATERIKTLKEQFIRRIIGPRVKASEFWALRDITLTIRQGEAWGLLGDNGAGKSTLLKVIARVQKPIEGRVWVRGVVSPLIELGAGFHPELTGRENIFLNGAMLGFSKRQMQQKFASIVEFSELAAFIDAPLRTYSSGMISRLGFAIASDVHPDILIIDEALSVGDEAFQKKCLARMREFSTRGVTILYVTHALDTLHTICPHSIWLHGGRIRYAGPTGEAVAAYRRSLEIGKDSSLADTQEQQMQIGRGAGEKSTGE
ncbi:MAG: ABC transporter ATP-binding protein [Chloroflexota bacterium]|nr:ABC transporter ATP-binding protein [Chloroflexota bacterium]